jgi:phosphate transport system permease protein
MNRDLFSEDKSGLHRRRQIGSVWQAVFLFSTVIGLIALAVLLMSIIDRSFGLIALEDTVDPVTLSAKPLETLSQTELIQILRAKLRPARLRTIELNQGKLETMSTEDLNTLVLAEIVKPSVQVSYNLFESIFQRGKIEAQVAQKFPHARLEFKVWLNPQFLTRSMSAEAQLAGVRTALLGTLWIMAITILVAFPIGVGAAIYLEEYAAANTINRIIQTNIDNLAGVPSIVYGILGLAIFVRTLSKFTGGAIFGVDTGNGRTILSAGLTMALLILPILIINAQEAIRSVPNSLRQASYGLGAYAFPGILTGTILAMSRAIGETAPLILVGASSLINKDPNSIFSFFTALPIQIYNWTARPQAEFRNIAAAAILVLLVALLTLNSVAIILRNRLSRRTS